MTSPYAILAVVIGGMIGAFGAIFMKKGSGDFGFSLSGLIKNSNLILGFFFYGISTIIFIPALKFGELSVLYPFVALSYVWVSLLSVKYLNERMNKFKWTGIVLIIIGVSLIGFGSV